jgi:hypothetical protein
MTACLQPRESREYQREYTHAEPTQLTNSSTIQSRTTHATHEHPSKPPPPLYKRGVRPSVSTPVNGQTRRIRTPEPSGARARRLTVPRCWSCTRAVRAPLRVQGFWACRGTMYPLQPTKGQS